MKELLNFEEWKECYAEEILKQNYSEYLNEYLGEEQ